jgi:hypothetical protein
MDLLRGRHHSLFGTTLLLLLWSAVQASAADVVGTVRDETGGALPGVTVELSAAGGPVRTVQTGPDGAYRFDGVAPGPVDLSFSLVNFGTARRQVSVPATGNVVADTVLFLSLSADVTVTGRRTFVNLADAEDPAQNLVGIAQSASQGAITARQLDVRPIMRAGEVLETIPGVIISQHSGEGKANQYYLRGFNLDHGTDFATTVAGIPVNMPTHGHGHGYSDLSFLIPELVSGVQFAKGPYFAEQGDFATAGSANINYTNSLDAPLVRVGAGQDGFFRTLVAASPRVGRGTLLAAFEGGHNDGPWVNPDDYGKLNGLIRYTQGEMMNGFSVTGMGYRATWDSTDQVPLRAVEQGLIDRFGALDASDGGDSYRYSGSFDWTRTRGNAATRVTAYGLSYDLNLYSNFTFLLDDAENGDQFHQADHRFVSGARASHRRQTRWGGRAVQNTFGGQLRNDAISTVGLYHTAARAPIDTTREDDVLQTSGAGFFENETAWSPTLRTLVGLRADAYRFDVTSDNPLNSGTETDGLVSPKGGVIVGPFSGTEFYLNAGLGFHSNDARGATITIDPATGEPADRVTPLARAKGIEGGVRTVAYKGLQTSLTIWSLSLDSELVFVGDAGTTDAGRPSHRHGIEFANYYRPRPWLTFDFDWTWSHGHFTDDDEAGDSIPGAAETVVSAGVAVDDVHGVFGSARLRYFGPRPLIEDDSVRSEATAIVNLQTGYKVSPRIRLVLDIFNLFDAEDSDIDYFYGSRLPGEPEGGVEDIHFHPTIPFTARLGLAVTF